jgi:predicted ATPase/class 3 adenylate cyclase
MIFTFLFTDIEGSTALWERDPAAMRDALARHDEILRRVIEAHRGRVFKTMGDAFCAAFGSAPDAVQAALAIQRGLLTEGAAQLPRVRLALHAGEAEERNGDYFGPALNRVARLLAVGHGGQTLFSQTAYDLVRDALPAETELRDLGQHRLKDLQRPEQVFELRHAAIPGDFPPLRSLEALPNNLPLQPTSFVGRERELAELKGLLRGTRLLTLTGAGGSGKTRLALQLAADLLDEFSDGVWVVDLAMLTDPELVPQVASAALGMREAPGRSPTDALTDHLRSRKLLLVLDNCEQVVEACATLAATLMRSCPGLVILATSREAFGAPGELVWPVPALSAPDPGRLATSPADRVAALAKSEAVRLFLERARLSQRGFALSGQNALAVAQICHRLDGIPLAIELAAGRVKMLSPEQIAARLDDRFKLLTGGSRTAMPRHQTLRAAIDWSYGLLDEQERTLLRRLSVFAGGWMLEAAETVCQGDGIDAADVLELQGHLVDKSLVVVEQGVGGLARYRLLGTIRQYAGDRLFEAGETAHVRDRHAEWFLSFAEAAAAELRGADQALWLARLEEEYDNLRATFEWREADESGIEAELRLAGALQRYWTIRGLPAEGRRRVESALARDTGAHPGPRAKALRGAGLLAWVQNEHEAAQARLEESLALYRTVDDKRGLARLLHIYGYVLLDLREFERARAQMEEGLAIARALPDQELIGFFLNNLGERARVRGDYDEARSLYEEALAAYGDAWNTGRTVGLANLGLVAYAQGDFSSARSCFVDSLAVARHLGDKSSMAGAVEGLAGVYAELGEPQRAARLLAAVDAMRMAIHLPIGDADRPQYDRYVTAAKSATDSDSFAAAWREGAAMTLEQAIELALTGPPEGSVSTTAPAPAEARALAGPPETVRARS